MREPWLWEEADILSMVTNAVQESLTLDYKRCDSLQKIEGKKKEISKDVSAFANSAGGVIIYGVEEDKHVPTGIDVGFDPLVISKEWLEQVINSTIKRRIDGIRIKEIALSGSKAGKVIYVVSIPQSRRAAHMAADNRYYKRFNFESIPMEDYEVRDVSRRLEVPDLFMSFRMANLASLSVDQRNPVRIGPIHTEAIIGNSSPAAATFAFFTYCTDIRLTDPTATPDNSIEYQGNSIPVFYHAVEWRGQNLLPLWETLLFKLAEFQMTLPRVEGSYYIFWDAQAPMMERKCGVVVIRYSYNSGVQVQEEACDWNLKKEVFWKPR